MSKVISKKFLDTINKATSVVPSVYAFSLPKAGSTLFFLMLRDICYASGISWVDLPSYSFLNGFQFDSKSMNKKNLNIYNNDVGHCFCGFRFLPNKIQLHGLEHLKIALLVRDPRDILVSHYFSMKYSHNKFETTSMNIDNIRRRDKFLYLYNAANNNTLDEYVIGSSDHIKNSFNTYMKIIDYENIEIYRYEDIVFNKLKWIESIAHHFGWSVPCEVLNQIVSQYDIFPEHEDITKHIRKVTPGDYKEKLSLKTIYFLDKKFSDIYKIFGYSEV